MALYGLNENDLRRLQRLLQAFEKGELTQGAPQQPAKLPPRSIIEFGEVVSGIGGSTSGTLPAGDVLLHTFSTTAASTSGVTAQTTETVEVYNVSPYSLSASDRVLLHRHNRTGKWLAEAIPAPNVQFGEPDATITAATSSNSTGGTFSIFKLGTTGNVVDTSNNITLVNLTNGALPSDEQTMAFYHYASNAYLTARPKIVEFGKANASIAGLTTGGKASSGTFTVYDLSSTGGITSASTTLTAWNLQPSAISASSTGSPYFLLHRHHRSARWIIDPPPHVVEIAKADSDISACTTGGTAGSGTCSIYTLSTDNVLTDTNINVTAYNLSIDAVTAGKTLQLVRHYRTGKWLVNFEDCGTT